MITLGVFWISSVYGSNVILLYFGTVIVDLAIFDAVRTFARRD